MAIACPVCGAAMNDYDQFCGTCGAPRASSEEFVNGPPEGYVAPDPTNPYAAPQVDNTPVYSIEWLRLAKAVKVMNLGFIFLILFGIGTRVLTTFVGGTIVHSADESNQSEFVMPSVERISEGDSAADVSSDAAPSTASELSAESAAESPSGVESTEPSSELSESAAESSSDTESAETTPPTEADAISEEPMQEFSDDDVFGAMNHVAPLAIGLMVFSVVAVGIRIWFIVGAIQTAGALGHSVFARVMWGVCGWLIPLIPLLVLETKANNRFKKAGYKPGFLWPNQSQFTQTWQAPASAGMQTGYLDPHQKS